MALLLTLSTVPAFAIQRDPRLHQVQAQVTDLQDKAEVAAENWNRARAQLSASTARVAALEQRVALARSSYAAVAKDLGRLVSALYRSGNVDFDVQALFSDNPTQFLQDMAAVQQVGATQSVALRRIIARRLTLTQAQSAVHAEQAIAQRLSREAAGHKRAADAALARAAQLLSGLQTKERARLAVLQRAQAAAAGRRAAHARRSVAKSLVAVSGRVKGVVSYALAMVGHRYSFGAAGPSSFDCSGLVMASYRRIGIGLPHYALAQYQVTRRVSRGQLRPGDLVFFFGRGIQHVGMYIGGNQFVHAANYQQGVIVTSLSDPYYVMRTSGYGRVLN